jgi:hypothetical protein
MIKENEIKIGNWFQHNANWCYRSPAEVKPFIFQWEARDWDALGECTLSLEDIEPIPITLEILGKCGFDGSNFKRRFNKVGETSLTMYFENDKLSIEDFDWYKEDMPNIKYLHQLQNLYFALTGEELNYQP